jgi:peptidoglycan/xylan/chitin deacetylase (PgdA/CDA1 family)
MPTNKRGLKLLFIHIARLLKAIPLKYLIRLTGERIILPVYHVVSDVEVIHIKHLYPIRSSKQFERDLDFFLREYEALSVSDLKLLTGTANPHKPGFLLSFDDGLSEFYHVISPILIKKGVPAICFLNSAFIDNREMFFRYKASILVEAIRKINTTATVAKELQSLAIQHQLVYDRRGNFLLGPGYANRSVLDDFANLLQVDFRRYLDEHQPYLTRQQITELVKQGFVFGAHSIDHPSYSEIPYDQQIFQTVQSLSDIAGICNPEYRLFSFPFTDHGIRAHFFQSIFSSGESIADLTFGTAGLKKDTFDRNLQRIPIETGNFPAEQIVYGEYLYYMAKALFHKNRIQRK